MEIWHCVPPERKMAMAMMKVCGGWQQQRDGLLMVVFSGGEVGENGGESGMGGGDVAMEMYDNGGRRSSPPSFLFGGAGMGIG